jgi:hypothetical protein
VEIKSFLQASGGCNREWAIKTRHNDDELSNVEAPPVHTRDAEAFRNVEQAD